MKLTNIIIESNLDEIDEQETVYDYYYDIIDYVQQKAKQANRTLGPDGVYQLHEKLKDYFNKGY